jgi:hypothetical protein
LAIGKKSTTLHQGKQFTLLDFQTWVDNLHTQYTDLHSKLWPIPNQSDPIDRPIHGSVKDKLAIPQKPSEAYLTRCVIHAFNLRWYKTRPPFGSAFSYSRKPGLFGLVDYQSHQAWVLVSTISRLTHLRLWQHSLPQKHLPT